MEEQLKSFAGSTAGSILIAVGLGVVAFPYAMKYLVKNAEEQAIPWALGLGKEFYDEYTGTVAAALKKLEAEKWHKANPDITQQDLDIPGGPQAYPESVGLPSSAMVVAFADKEALAIYQHSGEWNLYGTRRINGQHYYIVIPKGITVYYTFDKVIDSHRPDEQGLCKGGYKIEYYIDGARQLGSGRTGIPVCEKREEVILVESPVVWP